MAVLPFCGLPASFFSELSRFVRYRDSWNARNYTKPFPNIVGVVGGWTFVFGHSCFCALFLLGAQINHIRHTVNLLNHTISNVAYIYKIEERSAVCTYRIFVYVPYMWFHGLRMKLTLCTSSMQQLASFQQQRLGRSAMNQCPLCTVLCSLESVAGKSERATSPSFHAVTHFLL